MRNADKILLSDLQNKIKVIQKFMYGEIKYIPNDIETCKAKIKRYRDEYGVIY